MGFLCRPPFKPSTPNQRQFNAKSPRFNANERQSSFAGLPSSPYYELGKKYCPKGTSSLFTFGIHGGFEAGVELVEGCQLLSHLANLGDARSPPAVYI